ncbi:MAG TPA: hypothetical protein VNZ57_07960 [Longimicrobiales bacterium]|nr:hypothetical protein [Longimicrobiales bacterium]
MSRFANSGAVVAFIALSGLVLAAGCVTRTVPVTPPPAATASAVQPTLIVEQFLRAANANDLEGMGRLFGTSDGSTFRLDPRSIVEQRMFALASVLRHQDFSIERAAPVPGRSQEAVQVFVRLLMNGQWIPVPFTVVTGRDGWVVEQFDIEAITNRP